MLNKIILIGRLTRDPELRYTPNGTAVSNFTLAVDRNYKNRDGEYDTDFIDIVVWRKQAEHCANHLEKGRLVAVEGRLQIRSYTNKDDQKRYVTEVVANSVQFLDWGNKNKSKSNNNSNSKSKKEEKNIDDEPIDVPF